MEKEIKITLKSWGCTNVEIVGESVWCSNEFGIENELPLIDIDLDDESCLKEAKWYSCCGNILDKDLRICPSCLEHN